MGEHSDLIMYYALGIMHVAEHFLGLELLKILI